MNRVLIVEDEAGMAKPHRQGPLVTGLCDKGLRRRRTATAIASDADFDLVILDLGLPDVDGLSVLREIRRRGERMPVIALTARDDLTDKVEGLDAGASDYVTKPFKLEELLARVRVQLRDERSAEPTVLEAGGITLDVRTRKAMVSGKVVDLTAREFTMLETFMGHAGQVLSREQLLAHVWGYDMTPARTWSRSTSATCAASSARTLSKPCAGWATAARLSPSRACRPVDRSGVADRVPAAVPRPLRRARRRGR